MPVLLTIRGPAPLDPTDAEAVLRVQHAAYRVEADLVGDDRIPPLHEDRAALLGHPLRWLLAVAGEEIVGGLGYQVTGGTYDIDRLVVDPAAFGRGVGRALVSRVVELADGAVLTVSTGRDNRPAGRLYETSGFGWTGDAEVLDGLWVSTFERPGGIG